MIATLHGVVTEKLADLLVIETNGVGYGLLVSNEDFGLLGQGESTRLYIFEYIREQQHDLYGFTSLQNKKFFEQLLDVNGVGPKMALSILNIASPDNIKQAVASGDIKFLTQANGVGRRVAERIVVELKDKVGLDGVNLEGSSLLQSDSLAMGDEAVQALTSLGYSTPDAVQALKDIDKSLPTEDRIKQALKVNRS